MGQFSVVVVLHTELVEDSRHRPGYRQRVVEWHRQALGASGSQTLADLHEFVSVAAAQRGGVVDLRDDSAAVDEDTAGVVEPRLDLYPAVGALNSHASRTVGGERDGQRGEFVLWESQQHRSVGIHPHWGSGCHGR